MISARAFAIAACLVATGVASAQPAPPTGGKVDAKSLMLSGVRLLEARDYLGALAVFKDAFARFPSAKILLNIGTTLKLLERDVDAANAYQRYLDAADTDPAKQADVTAALFELDKGVGKLEISVMPVDAEVQINDGEWVPAPTARVVRVPQGQFRVRARKDKFQGDAKSASINVGDKAAIEITLVPLPEPPPAIIGGPIDHDPGIGPPLPEEPRSAIGGIAIAHLDIPHGGAAVLAGITYDISSAFQVQASAILGPTYGGYAGASFAFLGGNVRPLVAAGVPLFVSNGLRAGVRAAGGVELVLTRHVSLIAELGAEVMLNPEDRILKAAFIPAVGASGRL